MIPLRHFAFAAALVLSSFAVAAAGLTPGEYVMLGGGWGTLKIKPGAQAFSLETVGANLHTCGVEGKIKGVVGQPDGMLEGETCTIRFQAKDRDIEVEGEGEGCRSFCGARAYFDGKFRLPPAQCVAKALQKRRNDFLVDYKAKRYEPAYAKVDSLYGECKEFYDWVSIDALRNDIALTQLRLGRPADCLKTLQETRAWESPNEKHLQEESGLPPGDFDTYIGVAKATWTNRKLCEKTLAKMP